MRIICKYIGVDKETIRQQLRGAGLRVTPARVALMSLLAAESTPLDVPGIVRNISVAVDQATVYRTLISLMRVGLVQPVHIRSGITHYELAALPHHHHLVCEICGLVEDIAATCRTPRLVASSFRQVTRHNLEYSGICEACAK